jgi:hypothetical protein
MGEVTLCYRYGASAVFDNIRYVFSTIISFMSMGVIIYAIAKGFAALPGHPVLHYILLIGDLVLLAYLEGLQVAILALENVRTSTFSDIKRAAASHKLAVAQRGLNVQRFLVGRQFFVVFVVFLCAQLTTYRALNTVFTWMPKAMFVVLIETGLPGALIVLAFGQLMPQLICATHPITFMNLPGTWSVIQLCLCFETVGVTHFSWVLSYTVKFIFSMGSKEYVKRRITDVEMTDKGAKKNSDKKKDSEGTVDQFDMNVVVGDADVLYAGAEDGLSSAKDSDLQSPAVWRWLQNDSISSVASHLGYKSTETNKLPEPATIVRQLIQSGLDVPRYLLPPHHPQHIPPHIVAYELLRREAARKNRDQAQQIRS